MKRRLCRHEALACARMKRSAPVLLRVPKAHFIGRSPASFFMHRRCASFKKASFVIRQKRLFCWRRRRDSNSRTVFDDYTISNRARSTNYATSPYLLNGCILSQINSRVKIFTKLNFQSDFSHFFLRKPLNFVEIYSIILLDKNTNER